MSKEETSKQIIKPEVIVSNEPRVLPFKCFRVYDMKRYTGNSKTDSFVVGYHLQKMNDTHTLCGYKTDTWKLRGRWSNASQSHYADSVGERDTMCFRCLRVWAIKNQIQYPRQWMIDRVNPDVREERKVVMRKGDKDE